MGTISTSNQSYTQQDINSQLYAEATPADTTYSRLNRDDERTEEIATYDYADPNQTRVERSQATNPPPVSGEATVTKDEFYNAEDHAYAAVNKKTKKPKNAESDGEGKGKAPPPFISTLAEVYGGVTEQCEVSNINFLTDWINRNIVAWVLFTVSIIMLAGLAVQI